MSEIDYTQFSNNTLILMIKDNKDRNKILERELGKLETELKLARSEATQAKAQAAFVAAERDGLRARADKLAAAGQGLAEALMNDHALNDALETWDAALADWRTARENS